MPITPRETRPQRAALPCWRCGQTTAKPPPLARCRPRRISQRPATPVTGASSPNSSSSRTRGTRRAFEPTASACSTPGRRLWTDSGIGRSSRWRPAPGGLGKQTHRPTILKAASGRLFRALVFSISAWGAAQADGSFPRVERHKEIVVLPFSRFRQAGHEDRCRPPPPVAAGNGAGGEGAWSVGSERAVTPRGECPKIPLSSIRSGACRHEGWHATRACIFTPKACQYPPFAGMTRLRTRQAAFLPTSPPSPRSTSAAYFAPPKQRRIGGMFGERTRRPPAQILGHIGRGASHGRGEESRLGPSRRAGAQRLRDSSTHPRWLKRGYPQTRLASTTIASDQATSIRN